MPRAFRLFVLSLKHALHQLRYDLARELVVGFCSLMLVALFYYMFNDFINEEVARLSSALRQDFANAVGLALNLLVSLACGRHLRQEWSASAGFAQMAKALGEEPRTLHWYWYQRILFVVASACGLCVYATNSIFLHWPLSACLLLVLSDSVLVGATALLARPRDSARSPSQQQPLLRQAGTKALSPTRAMVLWRLQQILRRNRGAQLCLVTASCLLLAALYLAARPLPQLPAFFLAYLAGVIAAASLVLQITYDLQYAWIEKNLGVSHEAYIQVLATLAFLIGGCYAVAGASGFFIVHALGAGRAVPSSWPLLASSLQFGAVSFVASFLVPYLVFQIDGRRVGVQLMSIVLISLFLATAIFASLFALALLPVVAYYGRQSQTRRFYRA